MLVTPHMLLVLIHFFGGYSLPDRAGVVAVPITAFVTAERRADYATLVRFAACKREDVIRDAGARLAAMG